MIFRGGRSWSRDDVLSGVAAGRSSPDLTSPAGTARDSMLVAAGTSLARITGVVRVIAVGAVLGPTYFGNAFLVTNALPNLVYYGFLAGSLVPTLLVPVLVRQIDAGRPETAARVCGGLLGIVFAMTAVVLPLAVVGLPALMAAMQHVARTPADGQVELARWLVLMTVPQVFLYAVAGTGTAVLYAHRRFALGAAAPSLENVGVTVVLLVVAARYGTHRADASEVPLGELLLLGLGATGAVAAHASLQWWGARRCGVLLRPRRGWRESELVGVIRRAGYALAQAGLLAVQTLALLVVASTVAGGAVALQIALNFYFLPIALIATPVGLAMLPRLARLHRDGDSSGFVDTFTAGLMLALFVVTPASVGYIAVAGPVAHVIGVGELGTPTGYAMVSGALAALAVGLVGHTVFFVATQASYAAGQTRAPLRSMALQTTVCLLLCAASVPVADASRLPTLVGGAYAVASLVGGIHLLYRTAGSTVLGRRASSWARVLIGAVAMFVPVRVVLPIARDAAPGRTGWVLALVVGSSVGLLTYVVAQLLLRSRELRWLRSGFRRGAPAAPKEMPA
jgi:putative peptidoglycan lipid II flippase